MQPKSEAFAAIERLVGSKSMSTDPTDLEAYGTDHSLHAGDAGAVVFPRTPQLVAELLKLCNELDIAVVPSGGRTGQVGGATALNKSLVLSLDKLKFLGPVDVTAATVRVGAGVTTQEVHQHCEVYGLTWPIDLASKGTSQIGGNISTNAGGIHVIRYGMTRNWVLGLQVATMKGELLQMNRNLVKNNTGWDLMQLFIGSEGTLGVITDATLRLAPLPTKRETLFLALNDIAQMLALLAVARRSPFILHAFEFFDAPCLERGTAYLDQPAPLSESAAYYVIIEFDVGTSADNVLDWLESQNMGGIVGGAMAQNEAQRTSMWSLRECLAEALYAMGPGRTHDVSVGLSQIAAFVTGLRRRVREERPDWDFYLFGHLGDGNVHAHLALPKGLSEPDKEAMVNDYDGLVFDMVSRFGGSISAEHGIGLEKRAYLHLSRTPEELAIYGSIKGLMDPKGLLNPGKVLPDPSAS